MTEENKKRNIKEELERAGVALAAAELLSEKGFYTDALSRLYYFLLYHIRALLLTESLEPKSHEGALRLFSLAFVKQGPFSPRSAHVFSKLMKYRQEAEYNPSYVFTREDVDLLREEALALTEEIQGYLRGKGYL
jgi:uncharacterized protein (UPF0332 family)